MGYLTESSAIVKNADKLLNTIYSSSFTQYVQGMGPPVLVNWYNINTTLSNTQSGSVDVDHLIGNQSPIRYNYIPNMPAYGMNRDLIPEYNQLDGGLYDLELNIEITTLPNSFKPLTYDHVVYRFGDQNQRVIVFRVDNVTITSIRNMHFYKCNFHMIDIDSETLVNALNQQVVKTFIVDLDRIGTNENCLIEDVTYRKCESIDKLIHELTLDYKELFYSEKYNAVLYQENESQASYDPHLNNFIIRSHMLEDVNSKKSITMVVFDQSPEMKDDYSKTFYRVLETGRKAHINLNLFWQPTSFTRKNVNPFAYYGTDHVYLVSIYEDKEFSGRAYQKYEFITYLDSELAYDALPAIECAICKYLNNPEDVTILFDDRQLEELKKYHPGYNKHDYELIPMCIFLLKKYADALRDSTH